MGRKGVGKVYLWRLQILDHKSKDSIDTKYDILGQKVI